MIVGSGVAGLSLANRVCEFGSVCVVTKANQRESATLYAQGGIAAGLGKMSLKKNHLEDTLIAGAGLCDESAVQILCHEGPERIQEMIQMGMEFTLDQKGKLDLNREGGHRENRVLHVDDYTGRALVDFFLALVSDKKNIEFYERCFAIDLITEHQINRERKAWGERSNRCYGVYVLDTLEKKIFPVIADYVCLATGGAGQVYPITTNPLVSSGDGIAMAYRAGCRVRNMEFIQFHPTALFSDVTPAFLLTEALRGAGACLRLPNGERFMQNHHPNAELAPRDIVARAIDTELKKSGSKHLYLDITHKKADEIKKKFPVIYKKLQDDFKLDITQEQIPIAPAAHYLCGGIMVDTRGRTDISFLYALGENASTGVHGGNRLASNSLLEALVFSKRAAESMLQRFHDKEHTIKTSELSNIPDWHEKKEQFFYTNLMLQHDKEEIQKIMWDYVGIVRSNMKLKRALKRIDIIYEEINAFYRKVRPSQRMVELRNIATVSQLIIRSALKREESRGLHYNIDYPENRDTSRSDTIITPSSYLK